MELRKHQLNSRLPNVGNELDRVNEVILKKYGGEDILSVAESTAGQDAMSIIGLGKDFGQAMPEVKLYADLTETLQAFAPGNNIKDVAKLVGNLTFQEAAFLFKHLTDIRNIGDAPIALDLLKEENLTQLTQDQIHAVAKGMIALSKFEEQVVFGNDFNSSEGHQYMAIGEAIQLSPEEVQDIKALKGRAILLFVSQFPNGASILTDKQMDYITNQSFSTNIRNNFNPDDLLSVNDFEGENLSGQHILLGSGSVVKIHNHLHFETDQHIINTMTPQTTALHPLRGAVTWVHVIDKETGKAVFANFGEGKHQVKAIDLANNVLMELGLFNEVGKKAIASFRGEDYDSAMLTLLGLSEKANSAVSYFNKANDPKFDVDAAEAADESFLFDPNFP